ncbi:tRNA lysidine(34) synthetase TilS [Vibrio sp. LaRot3]|uniref:tRNA lysidine(34) synthetase TilS n=1 Tax=Vibrio sp. LaRot3 TaxID=2998829 RepID=UPI0022CDC991|nr:tRNA lysidine(34) synthetase TilS [Vibrio sp. LaRot3]MDA0146854.1 tRNA lysidine(34) synthetase TilS [Vibrio sp. LaRot3]
MNQLATTFTQVIEQHSADFSATNKLVLGFSGGVDSRVMLQLLADYQQAKSGKVLAVHVHHGLSENADEWAQQCQMWCQQLKVECVVERVTLETQGNSIEAAAREARYNAIARHVNTGDLLLVGQHADDQIETLLLALKRGSGPKGLSAMAECMPFAGGKLVRPLLSVTREQIEQYANDHQLEWLEDESNQDTRFDRNYIRHRVTPLLTERWPSIHRAVNRSAQLCAEQESLLAELLSDKLAAVIGIDNSLEIDGLERESERVRLQLIRLWFERAHLAMPSRDHLHAIWQQVAQATHDANPILKLGEIEVRRFAGRLYHVCVSNDVSGWHRQLTLNESLSLPDNLGSILMTKNKLGQLSLIDEQASKLTVTFNPEGLSAHPQERGHSRKLKKLFQEYQVPSWLRRRMPIIMCGDQVVAVVGLFVDKRFAGNDYQIDWQRK